VTLVVPSAAQLPLSVVIVAKNEAQNLPRCLASVQGWVAEIVVVLNDTTDDSAAIAHRFGATVHEQTWLGYRDTKNLALDKASQLWALSLDADEEVSPALRAEFAAFFAKGEHERVSGARFPRKVWFIDRWITHGDWYPDLSLRLFRRDRARWGGDAHVHEKIDIAGPVRTLRGDLHHYSFPTLASHVSKINLFASLFVKQQLEKETRFSLVAAVLRPWWRFFRAYFLRLGLLDGFPGFYIACATAFSAFVRYSCLYEHERQQPPPKIPTAPETTTPTPPTLTTPRGVETVSAPHV
jgi:glycosyltransferase involved in cell wall biosynthesis